MIALMVAGMTISLLILGPPKVASASTGAGTEVQPGALYACVISKSGLMRIPNPVSRGGKQVVRCRKNEKLRTWSLVGPTGATGATGPAGAAGAAGPAGATGATGPSWTVTRRTETGFVFAPGGGAVGTALQVSCLSDEIVLGGGFALVQNTGFVSAGIVMESRPFTSGATQGWQVAASNNTGFGVGTNGTVFAICADTTP